ncbi:MULTISPECIES: hypothetical protein [unclassified Hyphomicrobium]|uniref:hypothetical protein n=1 Tax=unclassified Hyphomicrobium TaxID=2619925 RepID=UPI000213D365|nr:MULTISPECIES: hypothetical protein [unclassified Hyphomicrobium]CCB65610.1 protein of unknown function [Hyphomicrobium sp. MC1]
MEVPEEFKRLTQCFWQGSDLEAKDEEDWIARSLHLCGEREQAVVKAFLADVLARNPSVTELKKIWQSGSPGYGVHDEHVRDFFQKIHDIAKG